MTAQKMYTLLECDPSRFGLGGSTEDIGMITLDIILWVGVQSFKMTFPVQNDQGGWGHQHGKKVPKSHSFFLSGCGSPNNFLMSKENNALVVLLAKRKV